MNKYKQPKLLPTVLVLAGIGLNAWGSHAWAAPVSGTVFQDLPVNGTSLNAYGVKEANELGLEGITVTAYPGGASTSTANDGTWTLATTGDVRIEFTIPANLSHLKVSPDGGVGNALVQFVADGGTANLGLHRPADYSSSADPLIAIPRFEANDVVGSTEIALGSIAYSSTGLNSNFTHEVGAPIAGPVPNIDADAGEIGAVWGTAWQSDQKRLFAGTFLKRHAGLADGPGYVYVLDYNTTPATVSHKFNLSGTSPANGGANIDLGSVCRRSATDGDPDANCDPAATGLATDYVLPADPGLPSLDLDAYAKVGTIGFGDLDMQENAPVLWLINPYQKALISIDVSGDSVSLPGQVNQYPLASMTNWPNCTTGELRPWALSFNAGRGYLGVLCDGSISQDDNDLHAYVLSFNPNDVAAGLNLELDFSMGYGRHVFPYDPIDFNHWAFTYPPAGLYTLNSDRIYPQPLFSDIEFDKQSNMYLNFMDRWGNQVGGYNYEPISGNNTLIKAAVGGEIIKVCNVSGSWEIEGDTNCPVAWVSNTSGVTGSGEYFEDAAGDGTLDSTEGSLAILKGSGQIVSTAMDPHPSGTSGVDYWNTQGITTWDLETGGIDNWYSIEYGVGLGNPYWGKAHAIGDIEILTDPAPIEIGNRVWLDTNGNGVQDADEAGVPGVQVRLLDNGGAAIATATTDASGHYIFSSDPNGTSTASHIYQLASLQPDTAYTVQVQNVQGGGKQAALGSNELTTGNSGEGVLADFNDSDGVLNNDDANAPVNANDIPSVGHNNHSYDFGFRNGAVCVINQPTVTALCDDNGTSADASDDTFTYTINATASNGGATYSISGGDTQANLPYGAAQAGLGGFPISGGNITLTLTDDTTATCSLSNVTVTAPASCSNVTRPDLNLLKRADKTQALAGDTVTFTLELTNQGTADATGIQVEDNLPTGLTHTGNNPQQGTYDPVSGIWDVGNLAAGQTVTLEITVAVD